MKFAQATRVSVKPLIGLFGKSGGGKTMTALLVARGIVGQEGRIALIDTENGRGSYFADLIPGGYSTLQMEPPFSPENFSKHIKELEAFNPDIGIIDSFSHEWNGQGGYLDMKEAALDRMAGDDWKKREKCGLAAAARCKPAHNKLISQILRLPFPMILCFRGKNKVTMNKGEGGRTEIVTDDHSAPIQDSGVIFEMLLAGEVYAKDDAPDIGGYFRSTKLTHPKIRTALPNENEQFGIEHGARIAEWAKAGTGSAPQAPKAEASGPTADELQKRLWRLAKPACGGKADVFEADLRGKGLLKPDQPLKDMTAKQLADAITAYEG